MFAKLFKFGLLPVIMLAISLGIVAGLIFPVWLARVFVTFNGLFGQFLGFIVPLLVLGLIAPGIADLGKEAGKLLLATVALAYGFTLFAGFFTFLVSEPLYPFLLNKTASMAAFAHPEGVAPYFTLPIPALMDITTALVLAFSLGLGMAFIRGSALKRVMYDFRDIINNIITAVIIPCLPVYVFGIFLEMTLTGQSAPVLSVFAKIVVLIFMITLAVLLVEFSLAAWCTRQNPFKMLKAMFPAYITALGTSSSAATIPVTYKQVQKIGVCEEVASFTVPLCANIHMSGSTIKITACAMAIILLTGGELHFWEFAGFICMLGVSIVAGPGVPGGAIMAALGVLQKMLGFNEQMLGLMIALYIAMDSFGTACNVTGDGAIAAIINRLHERLQRH